MNDQYTTGSDRMVEQNLRTKLAEAPGLDEVRASVNGGIAYLSGRVRDDVDVKRAVLIAKNLGGLVDIRDEIQVAGASMDSDREVYFDPVEGISESMPVTGSTGDFTPIEEQSNTSTVEIEDQMASTIREGMDVFDSEGKVVGKVKEVRSTDFRMHRLLARDYYVPYFACEMSQDGIHLQVKGSELKDQGWAFPH